MDLDELLLAKRSAIGPAWLEYTWIHNRLKQFPSDPISINKAAAALGKDKRTVSRNFRRLEQFGLVKREGRPGCAHRYWLRPCH